MKARAAEGLSVALILALVTTVLAAERKPQASSQPQVGLLGTSAPRSTSRTYDPAEVLVAPAGPGRIWYVDGAAGSDGNDGRSEATAFKTIGKALDRYGPLAAGDTVRIKAGLYRERPSIVKSGTAAARITVGPFGNGEVIVDASAAVTGWTLVAGQVYVATPGFAPTAVVMDNTPLFPEFSLGALTEGRWYYDSASGNLYLWAPGVGSPATHEVGVIKDDAYQTGFFINNVNYVTLYGLTIRFAGGDGVSVLGNYNRVEKSRVLFNGKGGISYFVYSTNLSTNGEVVKNYVYHNMIRNWPRGRSKWGGWSTGINNHSAPNMLVQGNIVQQNGGEGILLGGASGGTIQDNIVADNWSVNIYVSNQSNVLVTNNLSIGHAPNPQLLYNNGDTTPGDNLNLKRLRPEGVMTADEGSTLGPSYLHDITIVNNIILNCRRGLQHYGQAVGSGLKNVKVLHNTIIVPARPLGPETDIVGISIPYNNGNNTGSVYQNNLVYANSSATYVFWGGAPVLGRDLFTGLTIDHNLWYHATREKPIRWGRSEYAHRSWLALPGVSHGAGDVTADPQLINVATDDPEDKRPASGASPGVNRGLNVGVTTDYDYHVRPVGAGPDIGAFE